MLNFTHVKFRFQSSRDLGMGQAIKDYIYPFQGNAYYLQLIRTILRKEVWLHETSILAIKFLRGKIKALHFR